jgi:phenylpyruvate tautomerase PptA (4-oxalocrotonate tautomerase family)
MPIIHVYSTEGWLSAARKKLMIDKITDAVVDAEGTPAVREITAVLIHELPDGGWSFRGKQYLKKDFAALIPPDPKP